MRTRGQYRIVLNIGGKPNLAGFARTPREAQARCNRWLEVASRRPGIGPFSAHAVCRRTSEVVARAE